MKHVLLSAALLILLSACATPPKVTRVQVSGAEIVSLPGLGIAIMLPQEWQVQSKRTAAIPLTAAAEGGDLRFALIRQPQAPGRLRVTDPAFGSGVLRSMNERGFSQIRRSLMTEVSGHDAFLCEASEPGKSASVMHVHFLHDDKAYTLVFNSDRKPVGQVASARAILNSVKITH